MSKFEWFLMGVIVGPLTWQTFDIAGKILMNAFIEWCKGKAKERKP